MQAEEDDVNKYKASKQADVLMIFYLFPAREVKAMFKHMGITFSTKDIPKNIDYYYRRASNGSTLSQLVHSWVLARTDRKASWDIFEEALLSDFVDVQGGTTKEGIHLGAMAGTVDFIQRCYTGINMSNNILYLNPELPEAINKLELRLKYRGVWFDLKIDRKRARLKVGLGNGQVIQMQFKGEMMELRPGEEKELQLAK